MNDFQECAACAAKPGSPTLCQACLRNRATIGRLNVALSGGRPLVGLCVLILKQGKLLLGKRKGSHGAGEYAPPGGHLEHLESFQTCAAREVLEETGLQIGTLRFLRVLNATQYAPKHYIDVAFVTEWQGGEPEAREPDKVESWAWHAIDDLPSPLFAMLPSAIRALTGADSELLHSWGRRVQVPTLCWDAQ